MRARRLLLVALLGLLVCTARTLAAADSPARFVPPEANVVLEVPHPRQAVDALLTLDAYQKAQTFPQVKELLGSTTYRRFYQLVTWLEKDQGAAWPDLLDRAAGNGAVLAFKAGPNPAPTLAVLEGTDERASARLFDAALTLLEGELARQESRQKITRVTTPGKESVVSVGTDFFLARSGKIILLANTEGALRKALDLVEKGGKSIADNPGYGAASRLLPADSLARVWLDMESLRTLPGAAETYKTPRDPALTVLFGPYVDVLGRTPWVAAGLVRQQQSLSLSIRIPCGREGMSAGDTGLHLPPPGRPGSRPLLTPRGVVYSTSFYLDVSRIWTDREILFGAPNARGIEQADKNSGNIPFNAFRLSKILTDAGTYHRVVVANQANTGYQKKPQQPQPAFAIVTEMRNPDEFARTAEIGLRGFALSQKRTYKITFSEEPYKDVPVVTYRFAEDQPVPQDETDLRFNFSPSFCRVGNQFVVSSTKELIHDLIDQLQAEARTPDAGSPATSHQRLFAAGIAQALERGQDQLVTQAVLDQAVPPAEARAQVKALIALVRSQGDLDVQATFLPQEFRYDIRLK